MKKYILGLLMLVSFQAIGQFVNYTNINGRYKWIAGKFDSTFTMPSGTTPSLRTGGGTGPGALFYNTSDSLVYQYTGTKWTPLRGSDTGRVQIAYVRNTTASIMTTGQVTYINGSTGNVPTVALAVNKQDSTSAMTFGFVRGTIPINGFGWITTFGPIDGINTNSYDEGEVIYLDSIAGGFTHDKPQAPYHMVTLGYIVKKAANGIIFTKIQNGYELDELHNVKITAPVLNKSVIIYDSVRRLWVDTTVSAAGLGLGGSGTTNYVPKWTSSTALGNSLLSESGGALTMEAVGANATFIVKSPSGFYYPTIRILSNATDGIDIYNYGKRLYTSALGGHYFTNGVVTQMNITAAGRVLIGTTTESTFLLDVNGTARVSDVFHANNSTIGFGGVRVKETSGGYGLVVHPNASTTTYTQYNASAIVFWNGTVAATFSQIGGSLYSDVNTANAMYHRFSNTHVFTITSGGAVAGAVSLTASAVLEATSTTKGFLPPRMTGAQAEAIATPAAGLMVYSTDGSGTTITSLGWWGYNGTTWVKIN